MSMKKIESVRKPIREFKEYSIVPPVPVRAFVGRGANTVIRLDFEKDIKPHDPDGNWESAKRVMGDGDSTVPIQAASYATNKWSQVPGADVQTFYIDNMTHLKIIQDDDVIEKVIGLFCN